MMIISSTTVLQKKLTCITLNITNKKYIFFVVKYFICFLHLFETHFCQQIIKQTSYFDEKICAAGGVPLHGLST